MRSAKSKKAESSGREGGEGLARVVMRGNGKSAYLWRGRATWVGLVRLLPRLND